jgi:LEA14-like dessication related protein
MQSFKVYLVSFIVVLCSCATPKSFEIKGVKNVKVEKAGFKDNIFNAELDCYNPNKFGVVLKKIDCDVFVNDQKLTHYFLDTQIEIPSQGNFTLPARLEIAFKSILGYGVDIMFNKPFKIAVVGKATVTKGIFTKNVAINYTTTKTLNLKEAVVRDLVKSVQGQLNE